MTNCGYLLKNKVDVSKHDLSLDIPNGSSVKINKIGSMHMEKSSDQVAMSVGGRFYREADNERVC